MRFNHWHYQGRIQGFGSQGGGGRKPEFWTKYQLLFLKSGEQSSPEEKLIKVEDMSPMLIWVLWEKTIDNQIEWSLENALAILERAPRPSKSANGYGHVQQYAPMAFRLLQILTS